MLRSILLAILLAQAGTVPPSKSSPPLNPPRQPTKNDSGNNPDPNPPKPIVQPQTNPQHPATGERIASYTGWLTIFTLVLAVGTIGLFCVSVRQGNQMDAQLRQAEISSQRDLRAYLGISFQPDRPPDKPDLWETYTKNNEAIGRGTAVFVTNHGKTPARDVRFEGRCKIMPRNLSPNHEFTPGEKSDVEHGPKSCDPGPDGRLFYHMKSDEAVSDREMRDPESRLYAYGTITYKDIFGNDCWTQFAASYVPESKTGSHWFSASQHNDTDRLPLTPTD